MDSIKQNNTSSSVNLQHITPFFAKHSNYSKKDGEPLEKQKTGYNGIVSNDFHCIYK